MTIKENGQSYLETQGIEARHEQTSRSDYNQNDEYSEYHPDALSDGDGKGRGTGDFGGHGYTLPDMTKPKTQMAYGNFTTDRGGNSCDISARKAMLGRSLYNAENQYGIDIKPDTSINVADGQYDGKTSGTVWVCPFQN